MEKNNWLYIIIIALIAVIVVINVVKLDTEKITSDENSRTITSSGTAFKDVEPNKVEINFAVETKAKTAQEAQTQNAELVNKAKEALKDLGLSDKDIETTYYNVAPEYSYDKDYQQPAKIVGYVAVHNLKATSKQVSEGGKIIDALSSSGVNRVNSIQFGLDEKKEAEVKNVLIEEASKNAREKANSLAAGTGTKIKNVISVSENSYYYPPIRYAADYAVASAETKSNLSPGEIKVTAIVNVVYSIE